MAPPPTPPTKYIQPKSAPLMLHSKTGNTQSTRLSFMAPMEPVGIPIPNNPRPAPSVFPNFQSYLRSQSDAVQGILGNELDNYSDANLTSFATSLLSCDGISIFGDGSVKEGRGAHATRIYASATFLESQLRRLQSLVATQKLSHHLGARHHLHLTAFTCYT